MKFRIQHYEALDSTNALAMTMAEKGEAEGLVIVAKTQSDGHGRKNRIWTSPEGGLYFTLLLRPQTAPESIAQVTLLAGVVVTKVLRNLYRSKDICIKWPNDILWHDKKVGGILSAMRLQEMGSIDWVVVGMGINVNLPVKTFLQELGQKATSLNLEGQQSYSCEEVLQAILKEWMPFYKCWQEKGLKTILPLWKAMNCTLGHMISVFDERREIFYGRAISIDDTGALQVRNEAGLVRSFDFGEISIRST